MQNKATIKRINEVMNCQETRHEMKGWWDVLSYNERGKVIKALRLLTKKNRDTIWSIRRRLMETNWAITTLIQQDIIGILIYIYDNGIEAVQLPKEANKKSTKKSKTVAA